VLRAGWGSWLGLLAGDEDAAYRRSRELVGCIVGITTAIQEVDPLPASAGVKFTDSHGARIPVCNGNALQRRDADRSGSGAEEYTAAGNRNG
jgi:hypothetical protein